MNNLRKILLVFILLIIILIIGYIYLFLDDTRTTYLYIGSESTTIKLYNNKFEEIDNLVRGKKVKVLKDNIIDKDRTYSKIEYNKKEYLIESKYLETKNNIVKEKTMYVRTPVTVYEDSNSSKILSYIKKGEEVSIVSYDKINENGVVNRYEIKYNDINGYVYGKYLVQTKEDALKLHNENNIQDYHSKMGDSLNAGSATQLDYYPTDKPKFEDNVMPEEVRALYLNASAIKKVDQYIEFAKNNNINAFVVDIKDNTTPAYASQVMQKYSKTNYDRSYSSFEEYKSYIKKLKDNNFYVIGRITVFKDTYYVTDHPESAIKEVSSNAPYNHNNSYWPSAYNRDVWEFNVELAKEAVKEMGFNEIQFDYVRFPDGIGKYEKSGVISLSNTFNETKSQAIQNFVIYATDEIHNVGAYVSIDVFGESAHNYVTSYGQYFSAISNVADVISAMPYPDHFNPHQYGISEVVWTNPYNVLSKWSNFVAEKQKNIPTPAIVRTWIQAYDTSKKPSVKYDSNKVSEQIQALYDAGLVGGYMTWNSSSNINKYKEISDAFKKEY